MTSLAQHKWTVAMPPNSGPSPQPGGPSPGRAGWCCQATSTPHRMCLMKVCGAEGRQAWAPSGGGPSVLAKDAIIKTETERERERGRRDIFAHPQMQKNALYIPQAVAGFRRAMLEIQQTPESPVDPHVTSMSHPTAPKLSLSILSKQ